MKISELREEDLDFIKTYLAWKAGSVYKSDEEAKLRFFFEEGREVGYDQGSSRCSS